MGNANSGRRPRREEERKLIGKHFKEAVSTVIKMLEDPETPKHVRLDAARLLIEQHIGKPFQNLRVGGENGEAIKVEYNIGRGYASSNEGSKPQV